MSEETGSLYEFEVALAEMARDLLTQETVQDTLDRIVSHTVNLVDGCEHAGILLLHRGRHVETAAASSDLVRESDRIQGEAQQGPCFDALRTELPVQRIPDIAEHTGQWPNFAPRARELGIGSTLGLLLYTHDDELGALDLYSTQRHAFTERSERIGWLLAAHAAVLYSSARTHAQLETALASRTEIGEALGLLMATYHLEQDRAFELLKRVSQDRNVKIRDLAHAIIAGELPLS